MKFLIGGEKGGSGKTTLAVNLAIYLATLDIDVLLVDADKQGTASRFFDRRNERIKEGKIIPPVHCIQKHGDVSQALRDLDTRYQVVIVDGGGRDSQEFRTALAVADLLLSPIQPSQFDLETLVAVDQLVGMAKDFNKSLQAFVIVSAAGHDSLNGEVQEAMELVGELGNFKASENYTSKRKVYRESAKTGLGVVEMKNATAKAEIQLIAAEFLDLA